MPDTALHQDLAREVGTYVYGVVPADQPRPDLRGLDDAEVQYVELGTLAAAVSELALDRPPGRRAELEAHTRVVDGLAESGTVVPVQFGSVLIDRDAVVEELLAEGGDGGSPYNELVEQLRGRRQLVLRATYVVEQVLSELVAARPDIAELRRRTRDVPEGTPDPDLVRLGELVSGALEPVRQADADHVLASIDPIVVAVAERAGGGVDHVLDVALLVDSGRIPDLEEVLEVQAEAVHERIRLSLSPPMAPYDFTAPLSGRPREAAWG